MIVNVQRLSANARSALAEHFLALPAEDRRLRFGSSLSSEAIGEYVARIDFERDAVFGVHDDALALIGVAHLALADDSAELGISVLPRHRGVGVGSALFARASEHARNRSIATLYMHCLAENAAIMHIARKNEMNIITEAGDADAHLELAPATYASITGEILSERLSLYDYALKANIAAWKRVHAALRSGRGVRAKRSGGEGRGARITQRTPQSSLDNRDASIRGEAARREK